MSVSKICAWGLLLLMGLSIAACCGGGHETKVITTPVNTTTNPTLGKQLEDLDAAYKKGAISKEEYETAKKNLIDQGAQDK